MRTQHQTFISVCLFKKKQNFIPDFQRNHNHRALEKKNKEKLDKETKIEI